VKRTSRVYHGVTSELKQSSQALANGRGTYGADIFASRALAMTNRIPSYNRIRTVMGRDDATIHYRRNRGDIQSVREVYLEEAYRLPSTLHPRTLIDLGANIGLVAVSYARRYTLEKVVAVEPVPDNVEVLRQNLIDNAIPAEIVQAAVGPHHNRARFALAAASNLGHLGEDGELEVDVVTMPFLLSKVRGSVDVLKIDIEGGEGALLIDTDVSWLDHVGAIIMEVHPTLVDYDAIVKTITSRGFRYHPPGSVWPMTTDIFVRE